MAVRNPRVDEMKECISRGLTTAQNIGATAAKICFYHEEKITCGFESGSLKSTETSESISYNVEALVAGRKGNVWGNRLDKLDGMIEAAVTLARHGSAAHFDAYPSPGELTPVNIHSEKTLTLSREQMIRSCQGMDDLLRSYDPDLWTRCSAERTDSEGLLVTSGGVCYHTTRTQWQLGAFVQRIEEGSTLTAYDDRKWCDLNAFYDPTAIANGVIAELRRGDQLASPPLGQVKALLTPRTLGWMLSPVLEAASGRTVAEGLSPLAGRLNQQMLASTLTILDDPHREYDPRSRATDSDGIATRKQAIFEKGVLRTFLYDLDSAGLAGVEPTGNDGCSPCSPIVHAGDRPSAELLASVKDGLYVSNLLGFELVNAVSGDFSASLALAWRVRDGEVVGRVKDTMISGNVYELFKRSVELSSDLDYEGRYPCALVEGIQVSA